MSLVMGDFNIDANKACCIPCISLTQAPVAEKVQLSKLNGLIENEGNYINQSPVGTCHMLPYAEFAGISVWYINVLQALTQQIRSVSPTARRQIGTPS